MQLGAKVLIAVATLVAFPCFLAFTDPGHKAQFVLGGAMINAGYRLQDHHDEYDFHDGHDEHRITPESVWQEMLQQNRMAASVRSTFPRTPRHPLVAMVVCMDARMPFSNGQCLPSGDLREGPHGLRRASLVLLTRAGSLSMEQIDARTRRIRQLAGRDALPVHACDHAPTDFVSRPDGAVLPLSAIEGRDVVLLTAVARPDSVRSTVEELGANVVADLRHRDHHRFSAAELAVAAQQAKSRSALLVTTEKDDARIPADACERLVLRIGLRFLDAEPSDQELSLS
jgi:hypothetical protein